MKCSQGHTMVPLCEHLRGVYFKCFRCGENATLDYTQYKHERKGPARGICPICRTKFWGDKVRRCSSCKNILPRVPKTDIGIPVISEIKIIMRLSDSDPYTRGSVYLREEWEEIIAERNRQIWQQPKQQAAKSEIYKPSL